MVYRVGDKVKCIRPDHFGMLRLNQEYVVSVVDGQEYCKVEGVNNTFFNSRFELIEDAPRKVFYTIIYKSLVEPGTMISAGFESEQRAMECKDEKIEHETFVAMKKITLSNL